MDAISVLFKTPHPDPAASRGPDHGPAERSASTDFGRIIRQQEQVPTQGDLPASESAGGSSSSVDLVEDDGCPAEPVAAGLSQSIARREMRQELEDPAGGSDPDTRVHDGEVSLQRAAPPAVQSPVHLGVAAGSADPGWTGKPPEPPGPVDAAADGERDEIAGAPASSALAAPADAGVATQGDHRPAEVLQAPGLQHALVSSAATAQPQLWGGVTAGGKLPVDQESVLAAAEGQKAPRGDTVSNGSLPSKDSEGVRDDGVPIDPMAQVAGAGEERLGLTELDGSSAVGVRPSLAPASLGPRPHVHPVGLAGVEGPVSRIGAERPSSPGPAGLLIEPQLVLEANDHGWSGDLGERVLWLVGRRESLAELRLDPPDLGSLEIRVHHEKDATSVHFLVQSGAARDLLESALPRLRELFGEAGLSLQHLEVSERQPGRHGGGQDLGPGGGRARREEEPSAVGERPWLPRGRGEGLIDTYA